MNSIYVLNDTDPKSPNRTILDLLHRGEENAVSMDYLASLLDTDKRSVRHMIEKARLDGNIIAGTNAGMFVPATSDELREYVNRTQSRIKTSMATIEPAIEILKDENYDE